MHNDRHGATLIELIAALALVGIVLLLGAAALDALSRGGDQVHSASDRADGIAAGERLLRDLLARVEAGPGAEFAGDGERVTATTRCDGATGWQRKCGISLHAGIESVTGVLVTAVLPRSGRVPVLMGNGTATFGYLEDHADGARWTPGWASSIRAPAAIAVISGADTLFFPVGMP